MESSNPSFVPYRTERKRYVLQHVVLAPSFCRYSYTLFHMLNSPQAAVSI